MDWLAWMTDHPSRVETAKEWKSTFGLRPSPHRKGNGFQFPRVVIPSTPSRRKKVVQERETTYEKSPQHWASTIVTTQANGARG